MVIVADQQRRHWWRLLTDPYLLQKEYKNTYTLVFTYELFSSIIQYDLRSTQVGCVQSTKGIKDRLHKEGRRENAKENYQEAV